MFDIGFLEVLVVFVLGLVVIGPERLPSTIKTCAIWFSRLKRSVNDARVEFEQQIGADEIRREIHNERIMESMRKMGDIHSAFDKKVSDLKDDIESSVTNIDAPGSENPTVPEQNSNDGNLASDEAKASSSDKDEPHEPMIHDESGEDVSKLPGRTATFKTDASEANK